MTHLLNISVHEAKTHLSRYLQRVEEGETIVVCRHAAPVAQIVPLPKKKKRTLFGLAKGKGKVTDRFFDALGDADLPGFGL